MKLFVKGISYLIVVAFSIANFVAFTYFAKELLHGRSGYVEFFGPLSNIFTFIGKMFALGGIVFLIVGVVLLIWKHKEAIKEDRFAGFFAFSILGVIEATIALLLIPSFLHECGVRDITIWFFVYLSIWICTIIDLIVSFIGKKNEW